MIGVRPVDMVRAVLGMLIGGQAMRVRKPQAKRSHSITNGTSDASQGCQTAYMRYRAEVGIGWACRCDPSIAASSMGFRQRYGLLIKYEE